MPLKNPFTSIASIKSQPFYVNDCQTGGSLQIIFPINGCRGDKPPTALNSHPQNDYDASLAPVWLFTCHKAGINRS